MISSVRKLFGKKMMALVLLIVLSLTAACGAAAPAPEEPAAYAPEATMLAKESAFNPSDTSYEVIDRNQIAQTPGQIEQSRLIVYTGNIDLIVKDTEQTIEAITKLTDEVGGYVAEANIYNTDGAPQGRMTIKIPAETYQDVLRQLRNLAIQVERENSSTEDVTEEFVDLEARKVNLQVTEKALQELLETRQETGETEDILEVYRELTNIRGQIEQIQGRLNFLSRSAAMSSIHIGLIPDELAQPLTVAGWQPTSEAREALRSLISAFQGLVNFWIWVIIFVLPVAIAYLGPIIVIIWLLIRWRRARRARKKETSVQPVIEDKSEAPALEKEE